MARLAPATQEAPEPAGDMLDEPADASATDPHGTLCVDARNGFNEVSRKAMLWTVRHL